MPTRSDTTMDRPGPTSGDPVGDRTTEQSRRSWRPGALTVVIALIALVGVGAGLYPMTAQWVTSYNQSLIVDDYAAAVEGADPSTAEQLAQAQSYNDALSSGEVLIERNGNQPVSDGAHGGEEFDYPRLLSTGDDGLMARIRIPKIGVDLPIYHGTSDDVLARGAGHLEGSHLPIGGSSTRAVITAHRGLANAAMFTDLDQVKEGDLFTVVVFDEVLTYRVTKTEVIAPEDTSTLRPVIGKDLVTLITCTPLGINTHRILVTGERITPTPVAEVRAASTPSDLPGFPWWMVWSGLGVSMVAAYLVIQGFADARRHERARRLARAATSGA